jgi:hypothetical protein
VGAIRRVLRTAYSRWQPWAETVAEMLLGLTGGWLLIAGTINLFSDGDVRQPAVWLIWSYGFALVVCAVCLTLFHWVGRVMAVIGLVLASLGGIVDTLLFAPDRSLLPNPFPLMVLAWLVYAWLRPSPPGPPRRARAAAFAVWPWWSPPPEAILEPSTGSDDRKRAAHPDVDPGSRQDPDP